MKTEKFIEGGMRPLLKSFYNIAYFHTDDQ